MFTPSGGEDHLGLGSVSSDQILPTLSPTINVVTVHPRYHSFYAFLLDEFWRRDLPRSRRAWIQFFRPRDFIYAVAMHLCDHADHTISGGVTGSRGVSRVLRRGQDQFDNTEDYIVDRLGGYGLYYRSVLAGMGLVYPGGRGRPYPIDVPTERGKEAAEAFRSAVADTTYYRDWFDLDEATIPHDVIVEYARVACLCRLPTLAAPDGPLLRDLFLHEPASLSGARRQTLRMFLDIADQTDGRSVDQDAFRQLIFFHAANGGAVYRPRAELSTVATRWRLYQAREYYSFAINALWWHLCDWGLRSFGDVRPIPLDSIHEHLVDALDFDELATELELPGPGLAPSAPFEELIAWLEESAGTSGADFDAACGITTPINEHRLRDICRSDASAARVAAPMAMLGLLYARFGLPERWFDPSWTDVSARGGADRLSIDRFVRGLRRRITAGPVSIGEVTRWLLDEYVILQHLRIATGKLPDNTFRFERDGSRLRFHAFENRLEFSDSRFTALSHTVHELGFCGPFSLPDHPLTALGRALLDDGDVVG
jgi:hypothetical protein